MTKRKLNIIITEDGSHSLYVPELKETYHSFHGAVQESRYVFIQHGIDFFTTQGATSVKVLELGLGTGLNALLVAEWAQNKGVNVEMVSLEAFPVEAKLALELNYAKHLQDEEATLWYENIHNSAWNIPFKVNEFLTVKKIDQKIEDTELENDFDVVFFDAFAPNKQSELWELPILKKTFDAQASAGVFVTYCAKGQLKRDLREIGYEVETLPGPPGKKEMVRGLKS